MHRTLLRSKRDKENFRTSNKKCHHPKALLWGCDTIWSSNGCQHLEGITSIFREEDEGNIFHSNFGNQLQEHGNATQMPTRNNVLSDYLCILACLGWQQQPPMASCRMHNMDLRTEPAGR
jgi:hypothetical protein